MLKSTMHNGHAKPSKMATALKVTLIGALSCLAFGADLRANGDLGTRLLMAAPNPKSSAPAREKKNSTDQQRIPVNFRCDEMDIDTRQKLAFCRGNVVVLRGKLLLCCDQFKGTADDDWLWQEFRCSGNVRALRESEWMWANEAVYRVGETKLTLQGSPLLQRGNSILKGQKIIVNTNAERAKVFKPRGFIQRQAIENRSQTPSAFADMHKRINAIIAKEPPQLPAACPLFRPRP